MRLFLIALIGAVIFLAGRASDNDLLSLLSKGIPVICLLLWLRQAPPDLYRRWISIGLGFSLLGDILLDWPGDLFVFGLSAFFVAHLAYLRAYLSDSRQPAIAALIASLVFGIGMFSLLQQGGLGDLLIPVACYACVISLMLWRALARIGAAGIRQRSYWLAAVGAMLFALSDSMIGIDRFITSFAAAPYAIIATYWLGQWAIAASAFNRSNT